MKVVISDPKTGKSYQTELAKEKVGSLTGVKIGDSIDGGLVGAGGYKLQVTGGSDKDGFPMRGDVKGARKAHVLISSGAGIKPTRKGENRRKTVRGDSLSESIAQLNTKITEAGEKPLEEIFPKSEKAKEGGKGAEKKAKKK
ncbi:MAG: 30S ribosomal protein S6e [Candidatus Micrarchaeota archaeon]